MERRIEKSVFISYRRTNAPWALAISQNLTYHGYDVFFDFNGIASGDFGRVILENIDARAHFIVLLTPSALEHCNDAGDWLRLEIERALETKRNIVPLMLEGFDFGTPAIATQLVGKLEPLRQYNALRVPAEYFEEAMDRLRNQYLNVTLGAVLHPASPVAQQAALVQQTAARSAPTVAKKELTAQEYFERAFDTKDVDERLRFYTEVIRLKPDYADAFNNRGVARKAKGDLDGALQDFTEAAILFKNRGNVRKAKGDLDGALQDYMEAIRLKPDYADAFNNRGVARKAKGDLDGALQDFTEAIRLKPEYADAFNNRGNVRKAKGDLDGALQDYMEAIRLKPDYATAFNNRGIVRKAKGDLDGALQDYKEAIRLRPDDPDAFYNRGNARKAKGDLDGALQDYTEAIRLKPDYANAFINRGNARKAKGDLDGALQDYDEERRIQKRLPHAGH
jgi:tetratricopeptide (TPR) repeat protein